MMNKTHTVILSLVICLTVASRSLAVERADPRFKRLPPGLFVRQSFVVPKDQTIAIGTKLGASIRKLSNTYLTVHGKPIQVNIIDAKTDTDAAKLYRTISNMKGEAAFCLRNGKTIIEYVGNDPALATKTSYELGFLTKPKQIRYRIVAHIATVEKSDYMTFNRLFNLLLTTNTRAPSKEAVSQIKALSERFQFGTSLTMRTPTVGSLKAIYSFSPGPNKKQKTIHGEAVTYSFNKPPEVLGMPYVIITMEITVDHTGITPTKRKSDKSLISSTEFWPTDTPEVTTLARKITTGKQGPSAKVQAILEWLAPGKNIQFGGPVVGSRWGVRKVLKQEYGQCWDFADLFVTLCRASGIPCRQVGGWLYGASGHVWAEYLVEGEGWIQVDATGGGKLDCGIYHIPYLTTENGEMPILYVSIPKIEIVNTK